MEYIGGLKEGQTLGIIAPSGPLIEYELSEIKSVLNKLGYEVKFGDSCKKPYKGYLADTDENRAKDIEKMFLDKDIDVVICIRGGYGCSRILDKINYKIIKDNPKIFIGYSDITALHIIINQRCNLITYHGPMAGSSPKWDTLTYTSLKEVTNIKYDYKMKNLENMNTLIKGRASGKLTGGNLSLIVSSLGTEYEIDTKDKILFIEEIGEYQYKLDRMFTQLDLSGKLKDCKGFIFGNFKNCNKTRENEPDLEEIILDIFGKYQRPILTNLKSGHCLPTLTLPMGMMCEIDTSKDYIYFTNI